MKLKYLSIILIPIAFGYACSPDDGFEKGDFSNYTLDKVVCQASSSYLVADNISEADLHVVLYSRAGTYTDRWGNEQDHYVEIPKERWRNHDIRFYLGDTEITPPYKTSEVGTGTLRFRAEVDGIKSSQSPAKIYALYPPGNGGSTEPVPVYEPDPDPFYFEMTVRPEITFPARKVPVIFHVINSKTDFAKGQVAHSSAIYKVIDDLNYVFGRKGSSAPNGCNMNIEFVPALYDMKDVPLNEAGINRVEIPDNQFSAFANDTPAKLVANYLWNVDEYLNIWIPLEASNHTTTDFSFSSLSRFLPVNYPNGDPNVEELSFPSDVTLTMDQSDMRQNGIIIRNTQLTNFKSNPVQMVGAFFGLIPSASRSGSFPYTSSTGSVEAWMDDMCDDTPPYNRWYGGTADNSNIGNSYYKYTVVPPYYTYTSRNIMEHNTHYSVITQDQAKRIDLVLKNAPRRQMWRNLRAIGE